MGYVLLLSSQHLPRASDHINKKGIIQWLILLERALPPTHRLFTIERTQEWLMLAFSALQQLSFLHTNDLIPAALSLPTPSGK